MKKTNILIVIIFIFISVSVYSSQFFKQENDYYNELVSMGQTETSRQIIFSLGETDEQEAYQIIKFALDTLNANLYSFDSIPFHGAYMYTKYVYVNDPAPFNTILFNSGRFFTEQEKESDKFISTIGVETGSQIGLISKFSKEDYFQLKTLKRGLEENKNLLRKNMILQLQNSSDFDHFTAIMQENGIGVTSNRSSFYELELNTYIVVATIISIFILVLIILYNLLNSYKKIGIEKLLGYSHINIWLKRILPILILECICFAIINVVSSAILIDSLNELTIGFIVKMSMLYLLIIILTSLLITIPFIFIKRIRITSMLKNMRPTKAIIRFNFVAKIILSIVLVSITSMAYFQISLVYAQNNDKHKNWIKVQNYAFVPHLIIKDVSFNSFSKENLEKWKKVYLDFNKQGAILAEFSNYTKDYEKERLSRSYYECNTISVNPNYLKLFDVLDEKGQKINISEDDNQYIMLISEKYKSQEQTIREYYEDIKQGYKHTDLDDGSHDHNENEDGKESIVAEQNIQILWIKDNQKFFSFKLDINPQSNNCVSDPIVRVITEKNGDLIDYSGVCGTTADPFQIKVTDYLNPDADIRSVFVKYFDLNTVDFPAISLYQSVNDQIDTANKTLQLYAVIMVILFVMILSIIIQNVVNYYEQNKRRLAIQQFMGHKFKDKHLNYFIMLFSSWFAVLIVSLLIRYHTTTFIISFVLLIIEFLLSIIQIVINEHKNILKITKGG